MSAQYLNSKVSVLIDVTDTSSPFNIEEAPPLPEIDEGVKRDLTNMLREYFTTFGQYAVTIDVLDVEATHRLVQNAEAKA